jgi:uncharacterized protein YjbI with pentapeptide repeats
VNRKAYVLISIFLAAIFGWGLGYIRLPYIAKEYSFGVGVLTAIAIISLTTFLTHLLKTKNTISSSKYSKKSFWLILTCVTTAVVCIFLYQKNDTQQNKIETQSNLIVAQSEAIIALEQRNLMALVATVLAAADTELAQSSTRSLSQAIIDRIADLSHSLKPYRQVTKDSIVNRELSRERGQLLLSLSKMRINELSFRKIRQQSTFAYAELEEGRLVGINLSGIDLMRANLKSANLTGTRLDSAVLLETNLSRAKLVNGSLIGADLMRANFDWADMTSCNLSNARLDGTSMISVNLYAANLSSVQAKYSNLHNAILKDANFTNSTFNIVDLTKANLYNANLVQAKMTRVEFYNSNLENVLVDAKWYKTLHESNTEGSSYLLDKYDFTVSDSDSTQFFRITHKKSLTAL